MQTDATTQNHGKRIVILGGGYGGTLAALRLAGKTRGHNVNITLINGSECFVERIRLHQLAADQPLRMRSFEQLLAGTGVRFVQGWVTALDPQRNAVTVQREAGSVDMAYDYLIYAPGSSVDREGVPGLAEHAHTLADATATAHLRRAARALSPGARLLVIGGGLTGIEAATELAESYPQLRVTLATLGALGADLSPRGAEYLRTVFQTLLIPVLDHTRITHLTAGAAHCEDGRTISFDAALWAGPFTVPPLARDAGLATDASGRLLVDAHLRSVSHENVYGVGDAAAAALRMGCVSAMPMGAHAADALAAQLSDAAEPAPFEFAFLLRCVSLGRRRALVQTVDACDVPRERVFTGWLAARIKELICRYTVWSLHWERRFPGLYSWPQAPLPALADPGRTGRTTNEEAERHAAPTAAPTAAPELAHD